MSKTKMSSQSQYQYADWNLTKLKGMIEALYYQDIITEATKQTMFGILTTVWGYARNAAYDLDQTDEPRVEINE